MSYRIAKAILALRTELKPVFPHRDTESDGTVGDLSHQSRGSGSDHNPWLKDSDGVGVVRAVDIDEDLDGIKIDGGPDAKILFDYLLKLARAGDERIVGGGYIIYEGMIYSEKTNYKGRKYTGPNAHKHHVHLSLSRNQRGYDSTKSWGFASLVRGTGKPTGPTYRLGDSGKHVDFVRSCLNIVHAYRINSEGNRGGRQIAATGPVDGAFQEAVREFQRYCDKFSHFTGGDGFDVSGYPGPKTLDALADWVKEAQGK